MVSASAVPRMRSLPGVPTMGAAKALVASSPEHATAIAAAGMRRLPESGMGPAS